MRRDLPGVRRLRVSRIVCFLSLMCIGVMSSANVSQGTFALPGAIESKLKSGAPPEYPALARQMNIFGVAKVAVTVNPSKGSVIEVRELGGNPLLVGALMRAVKTWTYEPSSKLSTIEVRFEFKKTLD